MKATDPFKDAITAHLKTLADADPLFAETLKKPNKNIDDCATYIINEVQKMGCVGVADEEVYGMAVHYYDEDKLEVGKPTNCRVVVNKSIQSDKKETVSAPTEEKAIPKKKVIKVQPIINQPTLF